MMPEKDALTVQILDKEYRVACEPHEKEALIASAHYLNDRMQAIRDSGKVTGMDRIAVMAALNMAHELLQHQGRKQDYVEGVSSRIRALQDKIEHALQRSKQMEI